MYFIGNLVGEIIDRMQKKIENEALIRPGSNLVLYSGVSYVAIFSFSHSSIEIFMQY